MQLSTSKRASCCNLTAGRVRLKRLVGVLLLSTSNLVWSAMPDDAAIDLVSTLLQQQASSYKDIVLTLIVDGRSLPQATEITMRAVKPFQQRTLLARTALCMSRDVDEAELVTNAAIAAVPQGDAVIDEFISEFVKYQRSSCLDTEILQRPPFEYATDSLTPGPGDVSPSR